MGDLPLYLHFCKNCLIFADHFPFFSKVCLKFVSLLQAISNSDLMFAEPLSRVIDVGADPLSPSPV